MTFADEGITGTSTKKRVQFNRMIQDARRGCFRLILTKEVSRFSRNILDTIAFTRELRALGVAVLFVTDGINTMDPDAELRLSIMASIAQEESRRTSSRVVWGQTRQMEQGVVFGHSMLGYKVKDGGITVDPEGAKTVALIFQKYAVEEMGTADIARLLTKNGFCTYAGTKTWSAASIVKILKNEKYVGDLVQKKTYTPDYLTHKKKSNRGEVPLIRIENHHEPIISRELWALAQERLRKNNKHRPGSGGHSSRYVFSGKIICGECGSSFVRRAKKGRDGAILYRWSCGTAARGGASACGVGKLIREDDAMEMLATAIRSLEMDRNAVIDSVTSLAVDAICSQRSTEDDRRRIQHDIERIQTKKEAVMDSYFSGDISKADFHSMNRKYDSQLDTLRKQWDILQNKPEEAYDIPELTASVRSAASMVLEGKTESDLFPKTILDRITVFKDRHMELRLKHLPQVFLFTQ